MTGHTPWNKRSRKHWWSRRWWNLAYQRRMRKRRKALEELTRESEDWSGGYR